MGAKLAARTCRCGETFTPRRQWQLHCSDTCRKLAYRENTQSGVKRALEKATALWSLVSDNDPAVKELVNGIIEDLS